MSNVRSVLVHFHYVTKLKCISEKNESIEIYGVVLIHRINLRELLIDFAKTAREVTN